MRATLRVKFDLPLPKKVNGRSSELIACPVKMDVSIYSKVPRVDIRGEIENRAKDHRLRAIFPVSLIEGDQYSHAYDQFYVIKRHVIPPKGENWADPPPTTHPPALLRRFERWGGRSNHSE